jgi:hypothetical protein
MPATTTPKRRPRDEEKQSLAAYALNGFAWLAFMLFLFWLAGLKL